MRFWLFASFIIALLSIPASAQERPDEVVKSAIIASGGEELLLKYPAGIVVGKGMMTFVGSDTPFTFEQTYQIPGRFRTIVTCEVKGRKWEMLQVVNDAAVKQKINGRLVPLSEPAMKDLQMAVILNEIGQLTPLLADRKFTIKPNKQEKATDTIGLLVQVKGYPEIRLGFERKTKHLVRCAYKGVDPDTSKDVEMETTFDEFQIVSGISRPTRSMVSREGKKIIEMQVEKYMPLDKVDPKAFILDE